MTRQYSPNLGINRTSLANRRHQRILNAGRDGAQILALTAPGSRPPVRPGCTEENVIVLGVVLQRAKL